MLATQLLRRRKAWWGEARGGVAHVLLTLLLVLQLAGPLACVGAGSSHDSPDLRGLSQALGQQTAICHHGEPDGQQAPDDSGTCCACILCHMASNSAPPPPVVSILAAPASFARVSFAATRLDEPANTRFVGVGGPRGPPLGI